MSRLRSVEAFDPHKNSWHKCADMHTAREGLGCAVVEGADGVFGLVAVGGFDGVKVRSCIYVYMYTHIYIHMCVRVLLVGSTVRRYCSCVYIYIYIYARIYVCVCTCAIGGLGGVKVMFMYTYICIRMYVCIRVYACVLRTHVYL